MNPMFALMLQNDPFWSFRFLWGQIKLAKRKATQKDYWSKNVRDISERRRAAYALDPEPAKQNSRTYYLKNHEEISEANAERYQTDEDFRVSAKRRSATRQQSKREPYREYQNNYRREKLNFPEPTRPIPEQCECCGGPSGVHDFHLDHCHETNIFRGWLCGKCNRGIGSLGDNEEGLLRALAYLRKTNGKSD
jgi:hypothetical protein